MVRKSLIVCGVGVILLSSILAPAAKAVAPPKTEPVYFSLAGGLYNTPQILVLTDSQPGAVIYYTTDLNAPLSSWSIYNPAAPIIVKSTETIYALAQAPGYGQSSVSAKAYRYAAGPQAAAPYFSLAGGTYSTPQTLTITSATPNASICYTTDGTSPVDANGLQTHNCIHYTGAIKIDHTELVEAVATAPGDNLSDVKAKLYVFTSPATSGNQLLGEIEGAIGFCGTVSPGSLSGYRQIDRLFTSGQREQSLAQVRNSSDYKTAFTEITNELRGLSSSDAITACSGH